MKNLSPAACPSSFSLRAPAKINWFLTILGKRKDGYHNIISLMQCISLYDKISFKKADSLVISSDLDIPVESNLVHKAASLFKKYTSCNDGAKITLQKNIPVSAGLGGGSSDAAYTLLGLNILWSIGLNNRELSKIGRKIGSDVPFFLNSSFALVEGRGERVVPLKHNKSAIVLLLVKPGMSVSTAWAYEYFDKIYTDKLTKKPVDIKLFCQALSKRDFTSLSTFLSNDLEKVVIEKYPVVGKIKERLLENGALISSMTGSGPTVFGVFESKKTALAAAYRMGADNWYGVAETIV